MATDVQLPVNFLGKSGLKVSNLCLGAYTFGRKGYRDDEWYPTQCDEEKSHAIMDRYIELGGNFLDTANVYGIGRSEEIIGRWLKKYGFRQHLLGSWEESLKRLLTDYGKTHSWDAGTPIEETLRTMDDLIRAGKIRYFGVSNICGWQLQKLVDTTKMLGLNNVISLQQQYSLLGRQSELDEFMVCKNEGVGVLPWSPLKGGLLTGKFQRGETLSGQNSRIGFVSKDESKADEYAPAWSEYSDNEQYWNLIELVKNIAQKYGKSISAVALRWLVQKEVVSSVIIGVTSLQHLEDNMSAGSGWQLTNEEMKQLDEASPRAIYYPFNLIWRPPFHGPDRCNPYNQ